MPEKSIRILGVVSNCFFLDNILSLMFSLDGNIKLLICPSIVHMG